MNKPSLSPLSQTLTFSQAIEGYNLVAEARRLAPTTLFNYNRTYESFQKFLETDPPINSLTSKDIEAYLRSLPGRGKITLLTYHSQLSALWSWCEKERLVETNIVRQVARPKPEKPAIEPYTLEDIKALLANLEKSRTYTRPGKRASSNTLRNSLRNRAIILLLLDTGVRATELCTLKIQHCDLKNRRVHVFGKGSKERFIPFSPRTGQTIWKYLATRPEADAGDYLFVQTDGPFNRNTLRKTLIRIGQRAGVKGVGVHRFRHTFAINFLRNGITNGGANPWALQTILGHEEINMVKTYLALAQADTDAAHKVNSPVENWRL